MNRISLFQVGSWPWISSRLPEERETRRRPISIYIRIMPCDPVRQFYTNNCVHDDKWGSGERHQDEKNTSSHVLI
ncbi:hypothetical protein BDFB_014549 [Asbolus verrucosus]|uniref:Uncharacterized protein n=1 Tax=Asbolus verrucosus TaxID=1661398 RepID=A0A482VJ49_ASBVE|nr:hypothetical protein BDFB_014549 [Asbolus verrucosus]